VPINIRPATADDHDAIWQVLAPTFRAGETYPLPRDLTAADALAYWCAPGHDVHVAEEHGRMVGTYYLRANQRGAGSHVANAGYVTATWSMGRGVARTMCEHSLARASARGFRAMQFNFVISTNERAWRLWQSCGFDIVGRLPAVFDHPVHGYVDAWVMYRSLVPAARD
jgi:ribosomal protein S18 acetylase RimI-like enzyme